MADVIRKATNKFTKGLIMDFSPENTQNEVLTHALNATLLTFNGNEMSLQNDMGNARVETAFLPEGYMPVGTCEYGGIIYIVSYNPLEDKSQIGCFPSPERNVSRDELGTEGADICIKNSDFQDFSKGSFKGDLSNTTKYVILKNDNLNPGDKFLISSGDSLYQEYLQDLQVTADGETKLVDHPIIALNIVSIEDSGKIVYLNSDLRQYSKNVGDTEYSYHILGSKQTNSPSVSKTDLDSYRNVLSSGYNVFRAKTSGKLAILAELITIDSYSVTHSIQPRKDENGEIVDGYFDVVIHTEVTPEVNQTNYTSVPKLKYYYLDKSQGYLQTGDGKVPLFVKPSAESDYITNSDFTCTKLTSMYVPTIEGSIDFNYELGRVGEFNFPKPETYHGNVASVTLQTFTNDGGYTKFEENKIHRVHSEQIKNNISYYRDTLNAKFYLYQSSSEEYTKYTETEINEAYTYYIPTTTYTYSDAKRDSEKYQNTGKILYKLALEPEPLLESQKDDTSIEKFKQIKVSTYMTATDSDYESGKKLWEKNGNTYSEVPNKPDDFYTSEGKYFTLEEKLTLVSIGNVAVDNTTSIYYYPDKQVYVEATLKDLESYWNFDKYPLEAEAPYGCPVVLYEKVAHSDYKRATADEIYNREELGITLYYKSEYLSIHADEISNIGVVYMSIPMDVYVPKELFNTSTTYNYIVGNESFNDSYPDGDPVSLYSVDDYIPNVNEDYNYNDLKLGNVKIPNVVSVNGLDLPFKYDYTIVPCMSYGKLPHLAVSNTVDFSKLHAFNQSNFNVWKYRIDGNQLRLTFGAEVFDTYETDKVDAIILEFYDLWGFAGSLEITDKKSYTGMFTKILDLNSLNSLSTRKISGVDYINTFERNINIQEAVPGDTSGGFKFNGKSIEYKGSDIGWRYSDGTSLGDNNDCGALYSNILYGVKTYFRRTVNGVREFIKKKDLFLFTLPIYNDYYYSVDNYDALENPQLEMFLTYKITDKGTPLPLTYSDIVDGYCPSDKKLVDQYVAGNTTEETDLSVIKYYKFKGTSNVSLEVGLKKEYSDLNLGYDPSINSIFSCNLQLLSDDSLERTFSAKNNEEYIVNYENSLNYKNSDNLTIPTLTVNKLGFDSDFNTIKEISHSFEKYNFLTSDSGITIPINYEFVIGYKIDITNIRKTQVPATTVCALCHMKDGKYNYNDFSIYEYIDDDGNSYFYSDAMYFNEGDTSTVKFGLARQVSHNNTLDLNSVCKKYHFEEGPATVINSYGLLNTAYLDNVLPKIGKLAFYAPHVHAIDDSYLSCIKYVDSYTPVVGLYDSDPIQNKVKRFNMVAHTNLMFSQKSEFYSTISGSEMYVDGRYLPAYTSVTAKSLEQINKHLVKDMQYFYAYNPDYDMLDSYTGEVNVQDPQIQFISNLISKDSAFKFNSSESLNDYIFIGPIKVSNYIKYMYIYSENNYGTLDIYKNGTLVKSQIQFVPNYSFCGGDKEPYLVSTITYNIPMNNDIGSDLEHTSSSSVIVKHHDETATIISGDLDKKELYVFDKQSNKLLSASSLFLYSDDDEIKIRDNRSCGITSYNASSYTMWPALLNGSFRTVTGVTDTISSVTTHMDVFFNVELPSNVCVLYAEDNALVLAFKPKYDDDAWILGQERPLITNFKMKIDYGAIPNKNPYKYDFKNSKLSLRARMCYLSDVFCMPDERNNPGYLSKYDIADLDTNILFALFDSNTDSTVEVPMTNVSGELMYVPVRTLTNPSYGNEYGNLEICGRMFGGNMGGSWNTSSDFWVEHTNDFSTGVSHSGIIPVCIHNISREKYLPICIIQLNLNAIKGDIEKVYDFRLHDESIVYLPKNKNYYDYDQDNAYYVKFNFYYPFTFYGTTIVPEDLIYDPNGEHRLYLKKNSYTQTAGGIAHRSKSDINVHDRKNDTMLFAGPSFLNLT